MNQNQANHTASKEPVLPPFKHSAKIIIVPIVIAIAVFFALNIVLIPMLAMEPVQNEDEQGAVTALIVSLAVSTSGAVIGAIVSRIVTKKAELQAYRANNARLLQAYKAEQEQAAQRAAAEAKYAAEMEKYNRTYRICEFCGGELEYHNIKGYVHESSYQDGYSLEVKTSTTGVLRENRVHYTIHTGTESYRCPHCHYYIAVGYELFNGNAAVKSFVKKNLYAKPEELQVPREQIEAGRLYSSFKITRSQIPF